MKEKKRRLELLSFYDHTGIERRLEEMAEKGWMIEKLSNWFWTYRRVEPRALHFTVAYFPKASEFDPGPSQAQQRLLDLCGQTGWKLACTWFQMQIFYSGEEDPVPIHTEPALEVETLHRACRANYLRTYTVLFVLSLLCTLLFCSSLISDTLRLLASPTDLMTGTVCLLLFVHCCVELTAYHTWRRRARRAAEHGLFLDTPSTSGVQRVLLLILALCAVCWAAQLLFTGNAWMASLALVLTLGMAGMAVLVGAVRELLKKERVPSGWNRALTAGASFLAAFVLLRVTIALGVSLLSDLRPEDLPLYAEPPLRITDLMETEYGNFLSTTSPDASPLLTRLEFQQRNGFGDEASPEIPELRYERYAVRLSGLYGFCESQLKRRIVLSAFWKGELEETQAAPWGAERAYRLVLKDGAPENEYLLCYEGVLVRIRFSWEPTPEQMGVVGERLA